MQIIGLDFRLNISYQVRHTVRPQKMARGVKVEGMYYLCMEYNGPDKNCTYKKQVFL